MSNIVVTMKDGTRREFKHEGRAGGSYTKRLKLEHGFVIITDEWDKKIVIPSEDVAEVVETPERF